MALGRNPKAPRLRERYFRAGWTLYIRAEARNSWLITAKNSSAIGARFQMHGVKVPLFEDESIRLDYVSDDFANPDEEVLLRFTIASQRATAGRTLELGYAYRASIDQSTTTNAYIFTLPEYKGN